MMDIGWSELLVIAVVAILVVGPRDLPRMLRNFGKALGQVRKMANEFQTQFNDALKEAELDEVRKDIEGIRTAASKTTPTGMAKAFNPVKSAVEDVKKDIANAGKTAPKQDKPAASEPAKTSAEAKPAEPATTGKPAASADPAHATKTATAQPAAKPDQPKGADAPERAAS